MSNKGQKYPNVDYNHIKKGEYDIHSPKGIYLTEQQYNAMLKDEIFSPYRYNFHWVDDNYDGSCGKSCYQDSIYDSEY